MDNLNTETHEGVGSQAALGSQRSKEQAGRVILIVYSLLSDYSVSLVKPFKFLRILRMRSYSSYQKYRKWDKVVEPLVKYNRRTCDLGYPLDFFFELEQRVSAGLTLNLNIATTLTGSKDNCLKTIFEGSE